MDRNKVLQENALLTTNGYSRLREMKTEMWSNIKRAL